jgi:hypothetical protein
LGIQIYQPDPWPEIDNDIGMPGLRISIGIPKRSLPVGLNFWSMNVHLANLIGQVTIAP